MVAAAAKRAALRKQIGAMEPSDIDAKYVELGFRPSVGRKRVTISAGYYENPWENN